MENNTDSISQIYSSISKEHKELIFQFVFHICTADNMNEDDDRKIEEFANRFNINIEETLMKYKGWDIMADNLQSLPIKVKEFLVVDTQPALFNNGKISIKRIEQAMRVFNKIGITNARHKEIYQKAQALGKFLNK